MHTKILYDEIYDIDISEGHYRASVEVLLAWEDPKTEEFLAKFGDEIIHGEELDEYLHEIWYPNFLYQMPKLQEQYIIKHWMCLMVNLNCLSDLTPN